MQPALQTHVSLKAVPYAVLVKGPAVRPHADTRPRAPYVRRATTVLMTLHVRARALHVRIPTSSFSSPITPRAIAEHRCALMACAEVLSAICMA